MMKFLHRKKKNFFIFNTICDKKQKCFDFTNTQRKTIAISTVYTIMTPALSLKGFW